jgi:proline racemase
MRGAQRKVILMSHPLRQGWTIDLPANWTVISSIDMHTGGEPLRIITDGLPPIDGATVLEKRSYFRAHYDHLRTGLMFEPRGHADMYGAVISPSQAGGFDVFFLHNEGYSTMCGHAIIALTKLAVEAGRSNGSSVTFNVPAGRIEAAATIEGGRVTQSSFRNVPSFLYRRDETVEVEDIGVVKFDIAYGGAFYAIVDVTPLGLKLDATNYAELIGAGRSIKRAIMKAMPIEHPYERELGFLYGTIFTGPSSEPNHHSRNVCIFAEGEVDRSATGSGVSARIALHHAKGDLPLNQKITVESILGTTMTVEAVEETRFGPYNAVIPRVSGSAHYTGRHEFWFDPDDQLGCGFIFR